MAPPSLADTVERAAQLQQSGRLQEAAGLCLQVLDAAPDHADANHLLGLLLHQSGRHEAALPHLRRAVAAAPRNPIYLTNLGVVLNAAGHLDAAVDSLEAATRFAPDLAPAYANLGVALLGLGRGDEAIAAQQRAIDLKPDYAEAHANLGLALLSRQRANEAIGRFRQALALRPAYVTARIGLANALLAAGDLNGAEAAARAAIALQPAQPAAHHALGAVLARRGQTAEAVDSYRTALGLKPDPGAFRTLGQLLIDLGRYDEAIAALREATAASPDDAVAGGALGVALLRAGRAEAAVETLRGVLDTHPANAAAWTSLGSALLATRRLDAAANAFQRAVDADPNALAARGNLLFLKNYIGEVPMAETVAEARAYGELLARQVPSRADHDNVPDPARRLRVGLVSGDFRAHPVARFLESVIEAIDPARLELFAYATEGTNDEVTRRLRRSIPNWREVAAMPDAELDALIVADRIDILLDMSGHSSNNRLAVFARKPAPIAVTWLGYFATTGVAAIDYVLANAIVIPETEADQWVERPWRLPETYLCFSPPRPAVSVGELPALAKGHVTFGSANNLNKLNDATVSLWADVLRATPDSRLLLRSAGLSIAEVADRTRDRFARLGIAPQRLVLGDRVADYGAHLARYGEVDIALDPFPYAGGTTSIESIWMGVPVLTLRGDRYVAHMGENILNNLDMPEWIAATPADYVGKATAFAADKERLAALRRTLRPRLVASPLMDAPRFARHLEAAFRDMWAIWCRARR